MSTITSWPAGRFRMPRIARRVVCGLSLVMATFSPTSAFVSVDLPTFGRPTNVTKPERPSTCSERRSDPSARSLIDRLGTSSGHCRSPFFDTRTSPVRGGTTRISLVRGARPNAASAASSASPRSTNTVEMPRPRPRDAPPVMTRPAYSAVAPGSGTRPSALPSRPPIESTSSSSSSMPNRSPTSSSAEPRAHAVAAGLRARSPRRRAGRTRPRSRRRAPR